MKWLKGILVTAMVLFSFTGCSVALSPRIPTDFGGSQGSGQVAANPAALGMPGTIGHGTFTVFAIQVASVTISNGQGDRLVMDSIKQTLHAAGYTVLDSTEAKSVPVLECRVNNIDFKNYTWFFPIVPTWGSIDMDLRLTDANGRSVWSRTYHGSSWNITYSFSSAVNSAMTEILDQFAKDATDPGFQKSCSVAVPEQVSVPESQPKKQTKTPETLETELKKIEKMKSDGLINEEEYLKLKEKIIDQY